MLVTYLRVNLLLPVIYEIRHRHGVRWTWVEPIWQLSCCVGLGNFLTSLNLKAFNTILVNVKEKKKDDVNNYTNLYRLMFPCYSHTHQRSSLFVTLSALVPLPRTVILKEVCLLLLPLSHTI